MPLLRVNHPSSELWDSQWCTPESFRSAPLKLNWVGMPPTFREKGASNLKSAKVLKNETIQYFLTHDGLHQAPHAVHTVVYKARMPYLIPEVPRRDGRPDRHCDRLASFFRLNNHQQCLWEGHSRRNRTIIRENGHRWWHVKHRYMPPPHLPDPDDTQARAGCPQTRPTTLAACLGGQTFTIGPLGTTGMLKPTWLNCLWGLETIFHRGSGHGAARDLSDFLKEAQSRSCHRPL